MAEKRYVVGGTDGWLNVKREPSAVIIAVPEYLQVEVTKSENGRDYFTVLEGVECGKLFSVKTGNLKSGNPGYRPTVRLQFSLRKQQITYPGGKARAITSTRNPVPLGLHPIQLPDFPHGAGDIYSARSQFAKSWFYLGQGNAIYGSKDRYLHTGEISAGCVTVDPSEWSQLYKYLILCRRNDGKTVGSIHVVR
jgi:hypothetical protein